jgi:hypothetical protein
MTSRERLRNTLSGEPIDRVATFDILHNIPLIEYLSGQSLTEKNGEDILCKAARQSLDLVRHFSVPDRLEPWTFRDGSGFAYRYEWWTGHVIERPEFPTSAAVASAVEKDIESIRADMKDGRVSHVARQHVRLFDEDYDYIDEAKEAFVRVSEKLEGTMLLPPEDVNFMGVASERFDEVGWWYLYYDYPEIAREYMDVLTDYQVLFIDRFSCPEVCPFAQISVPIGSSRSLLYPPEFFGNEVLPREKRKIDTWKGHGYSILAFLDGYKWPLIADFLEAGADEIHPLEPSCSMDVKAFRRKFPNTPLGQPIDCTQLLAFGSREEVRQAVQRAIDDAGGRNILIGSTSEIHPAVKVENALAMYDAARSYRLS